MSFEITLIVPMPSASTLIPQQTCNETWRVMDRHLIIGIEVAILNWTLRVRDAIATTFRTLMRESSPLGLPAGWAAERASAAEIDGDTGWDSSSRGYSEVAS